MRSHTAPAPSSASPAPVSTKRLSDAGFGVYMHWPFCASKCPYCDFNSHVRAGGIDEARFLRAYLPRAAALGDAGARAARSPASSSAAARPRSCRRPTGRHASSMRSARAGPLTPMPRSRWRPIRRAWRRAASAAIAQPASTACRSACSPSTMRTCARSAACTRRTRRVAAIEVARATFARCSFDLIYARPGQTLAAWRTELGQALALAGRHLSLYQLTIEPETPFAALHALRQTRHARRRRWRTDFYELTQDLHRGGGAAGLRDLQPRHAGRGMPAQSCSTGATASTPALAPARTAACDAGSNGRRATAPSVNRSAGWPPSRPMGTALSRPAC